MRDPARIERILDALRDAWNADGCHDMRLGQLLLAVASHGGILLRGARDVDDLFYVEDDKWERALLRWSER